MNVLQLCLFVIDIQCKSLTKNSRQHQCNYQHEKKYDTVTCLSFSFRTSPCYSKRLH